MCPVTRLDAATADAIMLLLERLRAQRSLSLILFRHDLRLVGSHTEQMLLIQDGHPLATCPTPSYPRAAPTLTKLAQVRLR